MRFVHAGLLGLLLTFVLVPTVSAQMTSLASPQGDPRRPFGTHEQILKWIDSYRLEPQPKHLPQAVKSMSQLGLFRDSDASGIYVGFMAGVIASNPKDAKKLVTGMFPMPPEDQSAIIKAIAYSGRPDWKDLMGQFVERMPARKTLIDSYLHGKAKLLHELPLESGPAAVDTLWGYYFATGSHEPVRRIVTALRWSSDKADVNKLTVGSISKWTLANNASRDKGLLDLLRDEQRLSSHDKHVRAELKEIVEAAETFETGKIRKEALAAIEELKRKGPQPNNAWSTAAYWGSTAIAVGCVVASAAGQVAIGLPCIITGALSSAAVKLFNGSPQ